MFLIQLMIVLLALYVGSRYGSLALGAISGTGLAASACSYKRGLDLGKDPAFQARLKDPEMYEYMYGSTATSLGKEISASAKRAVYIYSLPQSPSSCCSRHAKGCSLPTRTAAG